jgi:hypothetical protein
MELLLMPLMVMGKVLIILPAAALLPAALLTWLSFRNRSRFCLASALLWVIYCLYEYGMYLRILCTGECNIRVDLLLIYPLLLIVTAVCLIMLLMTRKREGQRP